MLSRSSVSLRAGQTLIDVLIASGLGAILLVGALAVLAPALRGSSAAERAQEGSIAARGLLDGVRSLAASNWSTIANLTPGAPYYLTYSSTSTTVVAGIDSSMATSTGLLKSFSTAAVRRNSSGAYVSSGGYVDSSTLSIAVAYSAPGVATKTVSTFITRSQSRATIQTDWSGGSGFTTATTTPVSVFASSTGINVSTTTGSFILN